MSTKELKSPPPPKLVKLNKAFKLAEQWVNNMTGSVEDEEGEIETESRPSRLGLGAKVTRKSQVGPSNDPVERKLHKKLNAGRRKLGVDEESMPSAKCGVDVSDDDDDDENRDSRTNAFAKKRATPLTPTPPSKKKRK